MDKIRVSGKSKDEAITKALIQLGTTSDRLAYNVLVQGTSGLFGIGAKPWYLEAYIKESADSTELSDLEQEIRDISLGSVSVKGEVKETNDGKSDRDISPIPNYAKDENELVDKTSVKEENANAISAVAEGKSVSESKPSHKNRRDYSDKGNTRNDDRRFRKNKYPHGKKAFRHSYDQSPEEEIINEQEKTEKTDIEAKKPIKPVSPENAKIASENAVAFLKSVLAGMNMEVEIKDSFSFDNNELLINLEGPDMGILIGKRGQTLDSLQYLCSLVVNKIHKDEYIRVRLDTEDYRKRREQTLRNLARNIAYKVRRNHRAISLEPMNPYERRIIHSALQSDRYVTTRSEGEEPFRHIIVYMKK